MSNVKRPYKYDWDRYAKLLGTTTDSAVAQIIGCSMTLVGQQRKARGIPMYRRGIDWSHWDALLGTVPDRAIAEAIGCTVTTINKRRKGLGIPSLRSSLRKAP